MVILDFWPFNSLLRRYRKHKEFNKKLAELKRLDPFNDGDE